MAGTVSTPDVLAVAIESSMREMLLHILDAHYIEPDEPSHRAVWIDLTLDHVGDSADVELARSGVWSGTLVEWLEVGPGIVRRVPLVSVELTNRNPLIPRGLGEFGKSRIAWWPWEESINANITSRGKEDLPHDWFEESQQQNWVRYHTEELALADASRRAIAWARRTEATP